MLLRAARDGAEPRRVERARHRVRAARPRRRGAGDVRAQPRDRPRERDAREHRCGPPWRRPPRRRTRAFERAIASTPSRRKGTQGWRWWRSSRRSRTAIARWKRAVELQPTNFDALYNLGVQLTRIGRTTVARPYLERFVRTAPGVAVRERYQGDLRRVGKTPLNSSIRCHPVSLASPHTRLSTHLGVRPVSDPSLAPL